MSALTAQDICAIICAVSVEYIRLIAGLLVDLAAHIVELIQCHVVMNFNPVFVQQILVVLPYLRVYMLGTPFIMLSTGMNFYINAQGFPIIGTLSVTIGAVANLILDPIFIFALGLDVVGAAIATLLSQFLSFVFVLCFLFGRKNEFRIRFAWRFAYAGSIISLGMSPFIMQFTNSMVQIACNSMLMQYGGTLYVSIMTIVSSVRSILDVPAQSITEGSSPIISYNYGARRPQNVKKAIRVMVLLVLPYTFITWLLVSHLPEFFVRIFSSDGVFVAEPISNVLGGLACFITMLLTVIPEMNRMESDIKTNEAPAE